MGRGEYCNIPIKTAIQRDVVAPSTREVNGGWLLLEEPKGLARCRGLAIDKLLRVCYLHFSISVVGKFLLLLDVVVCYVFLLWLLCFGR